MAVETLTHESRRPAAAGAVRACVYTAESHRGHARYTRDLLSAMASVGPGRGVGVELVTGSDLAPAYRTSLYPIHTILPPLADRGEFRTTLGWGLSRVGHYVRRERAFLGFVGSRPDLNLVHLQEYTPWLAAGHFRRLRRRGVAVVMTVHNIANYGHASRRYAEAMRGRWRGAWRECSALIVHTEGLRDGLREFVGEGCPPVHVTPHAVWEERPAPPGPARAPGPGEPARLLFFGMVRPNKGLHVLLRAMRRLDGCTLTVAGEPEGSSYHDELKALIAGLPGGRVEMVDRFIGETEIAGYFDRSHVVVLPYTEFAAQSGVLHQAVAHGRPVVASDVGGLGESVRAWGIGGVVAPDDERALAEGVAAVLRPERYRAAAEATGRVRAERTWAKMAEATCDVYRTLVG